MKNLIITCILGLSVGLLFASEGFDVKFDRPQTGTYELKFNLEDYSLTTVTIDGITYTKIIYGGSVVTQQKGYAELSFIHASVMLDNLKNVDLVVEPGSYEEIKLDYPLLPSRGVIYRDQDPASIPYVIDPKSITDRWYPGNLAEDTRPFILRDIRGTNVYVYPFQYCSKSETLRVFKNVQVRLIENNTQPINPLVKNSTSMLREMDGIYRDVFINYGVTNRDDLTIGEVGDIYVATTSRDQVAIQPYVDWKKEKGYNVTVEVVPAGTIINSTVQNAYNANNNILYVLLVGDWADIQCTMSGSGRPMDPQVGCVVGSDTYPDIAVGRFSGNSPADITIQVDKTINYEKNPDMGAAWYATATGIASAEGGGGSGDDGEADATHETVIYNDKLDPFTYENFNQIYDPGATIAQVITAVNNGATILNYTGHGSGQSWGTTGFSNSDVSSLTNGNKLPIVVSVACNNGDFDLGTCFAEAWLRKQNGGAIMFLGASISQPWDPPMRGQDYFMDVLIGGYDYTAHPGQSGISTTEQRTTVGSFIFNGLTLMCVESPGDLETAQTWNLFGDPALQQRTAPPLALNLTNTVVMVGVPFTTNVSTVNGVVENAMVALSQNGEVYRGFTDATGNVTINHSLDPGPAKLVVTAFNTGTICQDVIVIPPEGPYVIFTSVEIDDATSNNNGILDYAETVYLTVTLTNVGNEDATNVEAVIFSADEYLSILDNTSTYGTIAAGVTSTVTKGYQVKALENVPDLHMILFGLTATGNTSMTWNSTFGIPAHAPVLKYLDFTIDDASGNNNGRLDPGETVDITVNARNTGSAEAYNVIGALGCSSPYVTIVNSPVSYGNIVAGDIAPGVFQVTADPLTPAGQEAALIFEMSADHNITGQGEFTIYISQIPVLLVDLDGNHNSTDVIEQCLNNLEVGYERSSIFSENLTLYSSIFVCLGTYSQNHILTAEEGQLLADYLNAGGNIYMEGADTWYYDQQFTPTPVHPMFKIIGIADGTSDLSDLAGQPGSITEDMTYTFNGDNSYIDQIDAAIGGTLMFKNLLPQYGTAVSYDAGSYKTVGFSFELGGLTDEEFTRDDIMIRILDFFGISGIWNRVVSLGEDASVCEGGSLMLDAGPGFKSYLWNTGDTLQTITVTQAGEYWVQVQNQFGYYSADTLQLAIDPLPVVSIGNDTTLCYYHELYLDAGNPGSTYLWSTGETTRTIMVDTTGMAQGAKEIWVEVTTAKNCTSSNSLNINFIECTGIDENGEMNIAVYPIPSNGGTTIKFALEKNSHVTLDVYNMAGQLVKRITDSEMSAGIHELNWDGSVVTGGIYTYVLQADAERVNGKIVIVK